MNAWCPASTCDADQVISALAFDWGEAHASRPAAARPAFHPSPTDPGRHTRSAPASAGWVWRSSPAGADCCLWRAAAARCATPKRCCSSTTTSCRALELTGSSIRAWVPMTSLMLPSASPWPNFLFFCSRGYRQSAGGFPRAEAKRIRSVRSAGEQTGKAAVMLFGQDAGWSHHRRLGLQGQPSRSPGRRPRFCPSRHRPGSGGPSDAR